MSSFTGGKLKLKGSNPGVGKSKKKRKSESKELALVEGEQGDEQSGEAGMQGKETPEGHYLQQPDETVDRRTAAEMRFDERQARLEAERVAKMASKSHRDRVNDFNAYLANLTEHHDIPRVGPG